MTIDEIRQKALHLPKTDANQRMVISWFEDYYHRTRQSILEEYRSKCDQALQDADKTSFKHLSEILHEWPRPNLF